MVNSPRQALVLDFDGVIADSARESFVVALRTYLEMCPTSRLASRDPDALYEPFVALMPLGNRAEDFGTALAALDAKVKVPDQQSFDVLLDDRGRDWVASFHEGYYATRRLLRASDPAAWLGWMPPYAAFVEILKRRASDRLLAIATAKDRPSVTALLEAYGIDALFEPERLIDKEAGRDKAAHLCLLQKRLGLEFEAMTFVDDKVNHLDSVAALGVRCVLAAWGYNGEREHDLARARGYDVCTLAQAESMLFGASPTP